MVAIAAVLACWIGIGHARRLQSAIQETEGFDELGSLLAALGTVPAGHIRSLARADASSREIDRIRGGGKRRKKEQLAAEEKAALFESLEAELEEALGNLLTGDSESVKKRACVNLLVRISSNIVEHSPEPKYRRIKMDNQVFNDIISNVPGAPECLAALGFSPEIVADSNQWVWKENQPVSLELLRDRLLPLLKLNMENEARKRDLELEQTFTALKKKESKANVDVQKARSLAENRLVKQKELEAANAELRSHLKKARKQNLRSTLGRLMAYVPNLFRRRFNRRIFTKDVKVVDPSGSIVSGKDAVRLLRLLRRVRRKFALRKKEKVELELIMDNPLKPVLLSRWQLQVGGVRHRLRFWRKDSPVDIAAEIAFQLNDENLVDEVRISKWLVNEKTSQSWPDVRLKQRPRSNFGKIKEWIDIARQQ